MRGCAAGEMKKQVRGTRAVAVGELVGRWDENNQRCGGMCDSQVIFCWCKTQADQRRMLIHWKCRECSNSILKQHIRVAFILLIPWHTVQCMPRSPVMHPTNTTIHTNTHSLYFPSAFLPLSLFVRHQNNFNLLKLIVIVSYGRNATSVFKR